MHLSLSDLLTCPRCGPGHGLILMPHEVRDRRVISGVLGCPNCRERYPIRDREADLRVPGARGVWAGGEGADGAQEAEVEADQADREQAVRLAALMGLGEQPGTILMAGPSARHAAAVATVVEAVEVLMEHPVPQSSLEPAVGISPVRLGEGVPIRAQGLQAVVLSGERVTLLAAAARALQPGGRLVLEGVGTGVGADDLPERVAAAGLRVLVEEGGTLVAERASGAAGGRGPIA